MAVDNVNHLDIEADEEEQADGHIITTTTTSPSSASASLSSLNDQHHDDHNASPSAEKQLTPPSTPTSSKYEENDDGASDDLKFDDSSSTKEAAAQLLVSTPAAVGMKNNAIDNISPSKPEVISDVGPPIPYANINAEKKHVTTVGIEQTDKNYGPEPPAYMIAPTLADDHFAKKRGLIEHAVRIDVDDDVRDHDTDARAESLVIRVDDNSIPADVQWMMPRQMIVFRTFSYHMLGG